MISSGTSNASLLTPSVDIAELTDKVGRAWAVTGESVPQYLAWSDAAGIFSLLAKRYFVTFEEFCSGTLLNERGVDALLPILTSLELVHRDHADTYHLSPLAQEYLVKESPYYVGAGLYWTSNKPIPKTYVDKCGKPAASGPQARPRWPSGLRMKIPHSRNFAPCVVAARTGEFQDIKHLVDIGGGSGVFSIPLALDCPRTRVTLIERPEVIDEVREVLVTYGVEDRVNLKGMDVFTDEWRLGVCDGIFVGNLFHCNGDEACRLLCRKSFEALSPGGRIWIHEVLFNENKDGPLLAALWNALVIATARKPGARQRTASEIVTILNSAGFENCYTVPTAGYFSLVGGRKPKVNPQ